MRAARASLTRGLLVSAFGAALACGGGAPYVFDGGPGSGSGGGSQGSSGGGASSGEGDGGTGPADAAPPPSPADAGTGPVATDGGTAGGSACTPACGARVCGDDGCGGTCGACGFTQLCSSDGQCAAANTAGGALVVDAASQRTRISSAIYGMAWPGNDGMALATLDRWGGDESSLYNWRLDVFNASTWSKYWSSSSAQFQNATGCIIDVPGRPKGTTCSDWFVKYNQGYRADTLFTVPIIGWMAKDGTSVGDPSGQNPTKNAVAAGDDVMGGWVQHLVSAFGDAAHGGVKFYQLDNEPDNWKNAQADVHPQAADHVELWTRTQTYASGIKAVDPSAQVLFMSTMDPSDLVELNHAESGAADPAFPGHPSSPEYSLAAWTLGQAAAYEAQHGQRIVDCLDTHYPIETSGGAPAVESTRSLWDPTFDTKFYFGEPQQLFPRMQQWINQNYPGTGICVSEYFMNHDGAGGGTLDPVSGLLQAETLGLYGKYGVRVAAYWNGVTDSSGKHLPVYNAFAMYRNYDGKGHTFGDYSIGAASPMEDVSIFASSDSPTAPTTLWVMIVNKMTTAQQVTVQIANFAPGASAHVYQGSATAGPTALPDLPVTGHALQLTLAQSSMTLLVVPKG